MSILVIEYTCGTIQIYKPVLGSVNADILKDYRGAIVFPASVSQAALASLVEKPIEFSTYQDFRAWTNL